MGDDRGHAPASDGHGAETSHAEAAAPGSPGGSNSSRMDSLFQRIGDYVTGKIAGFVAFLFLLIFTGVIFTVIVLRIPTPQISPILLAPLVAALVAYYNRDLAVMLFIGLILLFILFP